MKAGEFCTHDVISINKNASVTEVAELMREQHVGSVVVVDTDHGRTRPIGVFTDRDIVMEFVCKDISTSDVAVGDAMTYELVTVSEQADLFETIYLMRNSSVRRLPVVDSQGDLLGLIASDDALELLARMLSEIVAIVPDQRLLENRHLE